MSLAIKDSTHITFFLSSFLFFLSFFLSSFLANFWLSELCLSAQKGATSLDVLNAVVSNLFVFLCLFQMNQMKHAVVRIAY